MTAAATEQESVREAVATEKRCWVRLTRACNNRCMFCLDAGALDGHIRPEQEIFEEIAQGRKEGAERLILSGGEPTIHPKYLEFVRFGQTCGYPWIQSITNGRVFSYSRFAQQAARNGLREVTFSIHGHTPELHDRLAGVPGAFDQAIAGLSHVLQLGLVANVDIVLNRLNYRHLAEMLEFFIALGIREFDLLHLVPFGRAFDKYRDTLFLDLDEAWPYLAKAFALRRRHDLHLWTNRFPIHYLEGAEDLIQEPKKLFDEVRGRYEMFSAFAADPLRDLECRDPQRCPHCFLDPFCRVLGRYRRHLIDRTFVRARIDLNHPDAADPARLWALLDGQPGLRRVELAAAGMPAVAAFVLGRQTLPDLCLEMTTPDAWQRWAANDCDPSMRRALRAVVLRAPVPAAVWQDAPDLALQVEVNQDTWPWRETLPAARTTWCLQPRALRSQVRSHDVDPDALREWLQRTGANGAATQGVAPCCGGQRPESEESADALDPDCLDADGRLDPYGFTRHFLLYHLFTKSRRCPQCVFHPHCRGHHINYIRAFGYPIQQPVMSGPLLRE